LLAIQSPLLVATSRRRSRGTRNVYVTMVVVMLLCIPMGIDLLFDYPSIPAALRVIGWVQFGLLLLSALFTLRRSVDRWLPPSERMKPSHLIRPGKRFS
jgi:protein-S-isoprenylcysteine O-methyltransferase Ste14